MITRVQYHTQSWHEFLMYTCRNISQSKVHEWLILGEMANSKYLLVEHTIVLVDICNITLVLIRPLTREFRLLIDAVKG